MSRRVRRSRITPPRAHPQYAEFEPGRDSVCPTPELLAEIRRILGEPRVGGPRALPEDVADHVSAEQEIRAQEALGEEEEEQQHVASPEHDVSHDVSHDNHDQEHEHVAPSKHDVSHDDSHDQEQEQEHVAPPEHDAEESYAPADQQIGEPTEPRIADVAQYGPSESEEGARGVESAVAPAAEQGQSLAVEMGNRRLSSRQPYVPAPVEVASLELIPLPGEARTASAIEEESEEAR